MSHQSGFRRAGRDFTHNPPASRRKGRPGSERFERRLRRKHDDHEKERQEHAGRD